MERKLATVIFVDLVDSTGYVATADPEVVRRRVSRFFERTAHCIETHGGVVEKFAGDAVMAAFGIPQAHEDDAERAVRAALAIHRAVKELGLEARIGVEAGEVVYDESESTFATGEAVNVAARLQQGAQAGEVLVGPAALRLTAGRIEVEAAGPLELRGLETVVAWRAVAAIDDAPALRSLAAPLIGRAADLDLLDNAFERARRDRRAQLFTIYGEPGVGKSRLAREFVAGLEGATVLGGRCLPYGEGITYWPLAEMVKTAAGIADDDPAAAAQEKLRESCEDNAVADLLGLAAGVLEVVEGERGQQEIAWAVREWAEQLASAQPLVLVFEDIHWAEEPLLELIEHLSTWVREAPLLLLCLARPELLDVRPGWGGGRVRATAIELEPLAPEDSLELADALLAEHALSPDLREQVLEKTDGNPLFVEETVRMLVDEGGRRTGIPDTLHALIAARIDRLPPDEKLLLQRAAVIGRIFWIGAIARLLPDEMDVQLLLDDLLRRDFLLPESRSTISGQRAFRFKHALIRDVAYTGLSKSSRADLHARFAEWLGERAGEELLEIRAYHLDQACALLAELDGAPPVALAHEAAAALETAGRRALAREANASARKLLLRSVELEPTLERRYNAARAAWRMSDLPAILEEMEEICKHAADAGNRRIQARALIGLAEATLSRNADVESALVLADGALDVVDPEDHEGRFGALELRAKAAWWSGDMTAAEHYASEALEAARLAGRKDLESQAATELAGVYMSRFEEERALPLIERAIELAEESNSMIARAWAFRSKGDLHFLRDEQDKAEALFEQSRSLFAEAGAASMLGRVTNSLAWLAWRGGDLTRGERLFRDAIRILKPLQDRAVLCETQRLLAQLLLELGRVDEAEKLALESRATVGPQDMTSRATTRMALGLVRAAQGRDDEAEALLREALEIIGHTDYRRNELEPLAAYAAFLRERGREEEAAPYEERLAAYAGFTGPFAPSMAPIV